MLTKLVLRVGAAVCVAAFAGLAQAGEPLKVGGTGGAIGAMQEIAAAYNKATGNKVEVLPSLGSNGSLRAVADGAIDLAITARELKPEEANRGLTAVPFARTALVFVTSHPHPNGWRSADLARIFAFDTRKWNDGTPLNIILRTKVDTDTQIISDRFPGMRAAIEQARQRPEVPVAATDQDSAELAQGLTGSFVQAGLSQMVTEQRNLRLVAIDGVEPTLANLANGTYSYVKPFYAAFKPGNHAAEALVNFLRSPQGREVLRQTGNLPFSE